MPWLALGVVSCNCLLDKVTAEFFIPPLIHIWFLGCMSAQTRDQGSIQILPQAVSCEHWTELLPLILELLDSDPFLWPEQLCWDFPFPHLLVSPNLMCASFFPYLIFYFQEVDSPKDAPWTEGNFQCT